MSIEVEGNVCVESGCIGGCCKNMRFDNVTPKHLKLLTPEGTAVIRVSHRSFSNEKQMLEEYPPSEETTVYVAGRGILRRHKVLVNGPCANLMPNGDCGIYEYRPPHCRKFTAGERDCNKIRTDTGLPLLTIGRRPG